LPGGGGGVGRPRPPRPPTAVLLLAMLAWAGTAWAIGWTRLVQTQTMTFYVNKNAIEKDGDVRRIWELQDLKAPDPEGVRSRRYLNEYDCREKMHRIGQMASFAGPMASGKPLFEVPEWGYWRKIPPDGVFVVSYVMLCVQ
jgi:hypothetical protein